MQQFQHAEMQAGGLQPIGGGGFERGEEGTEEGGEEAGEGGVVVG